MDAIDIAKNRAVVLATLRDPELEEWHIRDQYFSVDGPKCEEPTECDPPALKACYACALGFCALALGFDKFELVKPGERYGRTGQKNNDLEPVYVWDDDDAVSFVAKNAHISGAMQESIITLNDTEQWPLAQIADWMEQAWDGATSESYNVYDPEDDEDDYE